MAFTRRHPFLPLRVLAGLCLSLLALNAVAKQIRDPRDPKLKSSSVLVIDQSDSSVLYSRNSDVALPIASITKLMTSLVVLDAKQPLDQPIQITNDDLERGVSRVAVGATLTRGDLMHLALMSSENRAACALGNNYPGGMPAMVKAMNAKAAALGMSHSHFVDPTGLSSDNVASPADLAKLVIAASHNPTIREFSTDSRYTVKIRKHLVEFRNTDNLVANPDWNITVQKTGFINEAGKCLVMATVIDGRPVIIVLLDSLGKYTRVADAKRIKTWMLANANAHAQVSMR